MAFGLGHFNQKRLWIKINRIIWYYRYISSRMFSFVFCRSIVKLKVEEDIYLLNVEVYKIKMMSHNRISVLKGRANCKFDERIWRGSGPWWRLNVMHTPASRYVITWYKSRHVVFKIGFKEVYILIIEYPVLSNCQIDELF